MLLYCTQEVDISTIKWYNLVIKIIITRWTMVERFEKFSTLVSAINKYVQKIEADEMIRMGLKGSFAQYLVAMNRYPEGITSTMLCEVCDKDKGAVSRAIAEMQEKGLVNEKGLLGTRYRAKHTLTEEGKRVADYVTRRAVKAVSMANIGLSEEDRCTFYRVLELYYTNLKVVCENGLEDESR